MDFIMNLVMEYLNSLDRTSILQCNAKQCVYYNIIICCTLFVEAAIEIE